MFEKIERRSIPADYITSAILASSFRVAGKRQSDICLDRYFLAAICCATVRALEVLRSPVRSFGEPVFEVTARPVSVESVRRKFGKEYQRLD